MRATAPFSEQHLIERFADALWMERGLSDNTLAGYRADLRDLATWLAREGSDLLCASRADLQAYLASLVQRGLKVRTSTRRLSGLRQFYRWAVGEGLTAEDPTALIEMPRQGRPLPHLLTESQVDDLLQAPGLDSPEGVRDRCMLELLYATGLRVSELIGLRAEQISLAQGVVRVVGKGNKERLVPMGDEAADWVCRFAAGARRELLGERVCEAFFLSLIHI